MAQPSQFVPVYLAPDLDPAWSRNPGVLIDAGDVVPSRRGTLKSWSCTTDLGVTGNIFVDSWKREVELSTKVYNLFSRYCNINGGDVNVAQCDLETLTDYTVDWEYGELELVESPGMTCFSCGDAINEASMCYAPDNEYYCEDCYNDKFTYCWRCDKTVESDETIEYDGHTYCERCANMKNLHKCYACDEWGELDDMTILEDSGDLYCANCVDDYLEWTCEHCGAGHEFPLTWRILTPRKSPCPPERNLMH